MESLKFLNTFCVQIKITIKHEIRQTTTRVNFCPAGVSCKDQKMFALLCVQWHIVCIFNKTASEPWL